MAEFMHYIRKIVHQKSFFVFFKRHHTGALSIKKATPTEVAFLYIHRMKDT